jgi:diaminohydroxyphosphoribosylaminopyrimidine deaminase/5-amino-6-(5-phosphoribosylamino)uracil reductase
VDALIKAGIARVVAAVADPNPVVAGKGFERLRKAGIRVDTGLMEIQAVALNAGFFHRMTLGRPWVRVKTAQSLDGRTALASGESQWITSEQSRHDVQHWRARSDAILTGIGTVVADDPSLTVRLPATSRQPLRVIADSGFSIDPARRVLTPPDEALVVGCSPGPGMDRLEAQGVRCLVVEENEVEPGRLSLPALLRALAAREINEVQVEAGATLGGALLSLGLVDEILMYQAPRLMGVGGPPAFAVGPLESMQQSAHFEVLEVVRTGPDWRIRLRPTQNQSEAL